MGTLEIGIIAGVIILLLLVVLFTCYVKAPPSTAYVISGIKREPRILIGAGGVKIPIFERLDKVYLGQLTVDIRTERSVPTNDFINVNVDAVFYKYPTGIILLSLSIAVKVSYVQIIPPVPRFLSEIFFASSSGLLIFLSKQSM